MPNLFESHFDAISINLTDRVIDELNSFSKLKDGWDFGVGSPISKRIIDRAIIAYTYLKDNFFEYECSPLSDNSIQITFSLLDNFVDVIITDDSYTLTQEKGFGNNYEIFECLKKTSLDNIKNILANIKTKCLSLEQSISPNIVPVKRGLTTASLTWVTASPSFRMIARSKNRKQSVLI